MLVTHDGQLVIKQWPLILRDMNFFFHAKPAILYGLIAVVTTISVIRLSTTPADKRNIGDMTIRHSVSLFYGGFAAFVLLTLLLAKLANGPFDVVRFYSNNYLQGEVGELRLVDPDTLQVR